MKNEEQRIAIAEFCGAKWRRQVTTGCVWLMLKSPAESIFQVIERPDPIPGYSLNDTPDYPNDLNAMHDAEKLLHPAMLCSRADEKGEWLWPKYVGILGKITGDESNIHASAPQRAEAMLKTIGKWKD